jgi:soluble lytic murein transglycosylase
MMLLSLSLHVLCPLPSASMMPELPAPMTVVEADSLLDAARAALARGQAWRATWMLAPLVASSERRTPEAVLLSATAASQWSGWDEVHRLLAPAAWLDAEFGGRGRALLARAALERNADTIAASYAARAVDRAPNDHERGERLAIRARALDRIDSLAPAAAAYGRAAEDLPLLGDWLRYRQAVVTTDAAKRNRLLDSIRLPAALPRLAAARADGWLRAADTARAMAAYDSLGNSAMVNRLRLARAPEGSAARQVLRADLMRVVETRRGSGAARSAVATLDEAFSSLMATDELAIARALATGGPASRSAQGFARAFRAGLGNDRDRFDHGRQLAAMGDYGEAAAQFARVREPDDLAAQAAYQRGRALVRAGRISDGRTVLRSLLRNHPRETDPAAAALFLLGDLATDEGRDAAARDAFRSVVTIHPKARLAPASGFRAAIIAFTAGQYRAAAAELDSIASQYPSSPEAHASRYWAGRAWAAAGDSAAARERWRVAAERDRAGYYGARASARLGQDLWVPAQAEDRFMDVPAVDSAIARAALLTRLGMDREAGWELDAVSAIDDSSAERLLAVANALRSGGHASRGIRMASRAQARGAASDARTWRLLYPVVLEPTLAAEARAHDVDPAFAAALIRQESMFTPTATSGAGARGLMQVMPSLGRTLARARGFPVWDPVLLYQPDVNLQLGMIHLEELLKRQEHPTHVLAAYNAGTSRVIRWKDKAGAEDPEIFTERIPYVETRDYVRIVLRNEELYRALYSWRPAEALP